MPEISEANDFDIHSITAKIVPIFEIINPKNYPKMDFILFV